MINCCQFCFDFAFKFNLCRYNPAATAAACLEEITTPGYRSGAAAAGSGMLDAMAMAVDTPGAATSLGVAEDAANREAALSRYREKRKNRTFNTIRYECRKVRPGRYCSMSFIFLL